MEIDLRPKPSLAVAEAVRIAALRAGIGGPTAADAYAGAWRQAALAEAVERAPGAWARRDAARDDPPSRAPATPAAGECP